MGQRSSMIIILFLFFVTLIHLLPVTSLKQRTIQPEMDYYEFTQHWPGTKEDDDSTSTGQTEKPTTSASSSSSKGAKSKAKNKQDDSTSTEQTEKPTTSASSSSKGAKSKTKNKQQEATTSTTAGEQKNPKAGWRIRELVSGLWDPKKPATLKPDHIENFGIHGLWPQYFNGNPYPQYCLKQDGGLPEKYDFSKIEHLYDRLKKHWHSTASPYEDGHAVKSQNKFGLDKKEKEGIWEHEWEKHGTCSSFEQQRAYFEAALELRIPSNIENPLTWKNISNLLETLYDERIIPDGSSYPIDRIRDAIHNKIKVMPIIECNAKNELYQVHICLTKEDLELMDCIGDTVLICKKGNNIIFPSYPEKAIDHKEL